MGGAVSEDPLYPGRESNGTALERAAWSDNGSVVDRHVSAFVE